MISPQVLKLDQDRRISRTLESMRLALRVEQANWADILGISGKEYDAVRGGAPVSIASLDAMAKHTQLSLESFSSGDVDIPGLVARMRGDAHFLRDRYSVGAKSRRWSSINILDYVDRYFGMNMRALALKSLQVSEGVFASPYEAINIRFVSDLCDFLRKHGVSDSHFYAMGANTVVTYAKSPAVAELKKSRDLPEVFERFCDEICDKFLEQNFHYCIEYLDDNSCVIACRPRADVCDALETDRPGNESFCMTKAGLGAALPAHLGLPFADALEITCIHRGDDACRFEFDFESANAASRTYPYLRRPS